MLLVCSASPLRRFHSAGFLIKYGVKTPAVPSISANEKRNGHVETTSLSVTTCKILSGNASPITFLYMYVEYTKIPLSGYKIFLTINTFSLADNSQNQIVWPAVFLNCPKGQFIVNAWRNQTLVYHWSRKYRYLCYITFHHSSWI